MRLRSAQMRRGILEAVLRKVPRARRREHLSRVSKTLERLDEPFTSLRIACGRIAFLCASQRWRTRVRLWTLWAVRTRRTIWAWVWLWARWTRFRRLNWHVLAHSNAFHLSWFSVDALEVEWTKASNCSDLRGQLTTKQQTASKLDSTLTNHELKRSRHEQCAAWIVRGDSNLGYFAGKGQQPLNCLIEVRH